MPNDNIQYFTKEKITELRNELDFLSTTRRKEVAENLEYTKKLGDLSENAEYHEAREEQAKVEDRIRHLENLLKNAQILGENKGENINIGSTITITKDGGEEHKFKLVGSEEADMMQGKLSHVSPLGKAVMGKKKGDKVEFLAPKGKSVCTIVHVE